MLVCEVWLMFSFTDRRTNPLSLRLTIAKQQMNLYSRRTRRSLATAAAAAVQRRPALKQSLFYHRPARRPSARRRHARRLDSRLENPALHNVFFNTPLQNSNLYRHRGLYRLCNDANDPRVVPVKCGCCSLLYRTDRL